MDIDELWAEGIAQHPTYEEWRVETMNGPDETVPVLVSYRVTDFAAAIDVPVRELVAELVTRYRTADTDCVVCAQGIAYAWRGLAVLMVRDEYAALHTGTLPHLSPGPLRIDSVPKTLPVPM